MDKDDYAENYRVLAGTVTEMKLSKSSAEVSKSERAMLKRKLACCDRMPHGAQGSRRRARPYQRGTAAEG